MARPRNKIPSYLPHKPSGQARVRISGRDVYLGPFGSPESKEAYARLIAEHFANGESETIILPDGEILTVAALVVKYDDHAQGYYVKNGRPTDERYAIKAAVAPLLRLYGSTPAEEFGPKRLKAVRQDFVSSGRKRDGQPLTRKYVNYRTQCIVRMFRWAVEEELVPASVYQSLKAVAGLRKGRATSVLESRPFKPVPEEHIPPVLQQVSAQVGFGPPGNGVQPWRKRVFMEHFSGGWPWRAIFPLPSPWPPNGRCLAGLETGRLRRSKSLASVVYETGQR